MTVDRKMAEQLADRLHAAHFHSVHGWDSTAADHAAQFLRALAAAQDAPAAWVSRSSWEYLLGNPEMMSVAMTRGRVYEDDVPLYAASPAPEHAQRAEVEHAQDSAQQINESGRRGVLAGAHQSAGDATDQVPTDPRYGTETPFDSAPLSPQFQPSAPASERERFERTMKDWFPLVRERDEYEDTYATMAWVAWCARAALAAGDQQEDGNE